MKRTKEHQEAILKRIKLVIKEKGLTQIQLSELTGINQGNIGKYLNGINPLADGFIYTLICKLYINPLWLENGEGDVYLSPSISTEIKKTDVEDVKMSREVFNVIADQAAAIRSQQHIIHNYIEGKIDKNYKSCIF